MDVVEQFRGHFCTLHFTILKREEKVPHAPFDKDVKLSKKKVIKISLSMIFLDIFSSLISIYRLFYFFILESCRYLLYRIYVFKI